MNILTKLTTHRAWAKLKFPAAALIVLLQRTPAARVIQAIDEFVAASPVGNLLRSTVAAAASLGALHSLAGATTLQPSAASPVSATVGSPISRVAFTVTNTINIASWKIGGSIPPGLTVSAVEDGSSLTSPGMLDATTLGAADGYGGYTGGIASTTPLLSGTPTQTGSYTMTLQAFEFSGLSGLPSQTFSYTVNVTGGAVVMPAITSQPSSQVVTAGASVTLSVAASGSPVLQWQQNGNNVTGATAATLSLTNVQPTNAGVYVAQLTNSAGTATSDPAIVGVSTTSALIGSGTVLATHTPHPNGNFYDQVLLTGTAEAITTPGYTVRTSFIDLNDDIVQVEFSGHGTLSLVLDNVSGPATPVNYTQPNTTYMKGNAGIVITGADETTNLLVFTVGRATAFDPTGGFNFLLPISATNNPANNGSSLFAGHASTAYNGVADIAFIAISSANGRFGGLRASNASCLATKGLTGIYAPGVQFTGPVFISDIHASAAASPVFIIGSSSDTRITGGNLLQANGQPVKVSGLTQLKFTAGGTSGGGSLPAQANQAILQQNGADVTSQVVVNPASP